MALRPKHKRHLAAVMFTDVVGYTALLQGDEAAARAARAHHKRAVEAVLATHGGKLVQFMGDGSLSLFDSALAAVQAAVALQAEFQGPKSPALRIGIHQGEISYDDQGVLGDAVNIASRVQNLADPGGILVTDKVYDDLKNQKSMSLIPVDEVRLKGVSDTVKLYAVANAGSAFRPDEGSEASPDVTRGPLARRRFGFLARVRSSSAPRASIFLLVLIAVGVAWLISKPEPPPRSPAGTDRSELEPTRIAVLYFDDHTPDKSLGYLAAGLTEGLIHELTQVDGLKVISRSGVKPFRNASTPLDSVIRVLRAGSLVEGSVTEANGRIRATVQLVDGATGEHLSSRVLEAAPGDIIALQDSLAEEVARTLRQRLGAEIRRKGVRSRASDLTSLELFQEGTTLREDSRLLRRRDVSAALRALTRADSLLARAESADPDWLDPSLERVRVAHSMAGLTGSLPGLYDAIWSDSAMVRVNRILARHGEVASALELRGIIHAERATAAPAAEATQQRTRAERDLRRALELDPRLARAWWHLSRLYQDLGRLAEARSAAERAFAADAFLEEAPQVILALYLAAMNLQEFDDARRWCDEGRRRFAESSDFIVCQLFLLASVPSVAPDVDRAWRLVDSLETTVTVSSRPEFRAYGTMQAAKVAARAGLADSARAMILAARGKETPAWLAYDEAHARLLLGERDAAIELLRVYLEFDPSAANGLSTDWWFKALQSDPRFKRLIPGQG